jgi:hypothetical protein
MKHPPYHLRPNKAIDRFMLIEAIRCLEKLYSLSKYTYYSLGGPYLEDFRMLYEYCPEVAMTSIEMDLETYKRQKLHLPCRHLKLMHVPFKSFLAQYESRNRMSIFWLDYVGLSYSAMDDFMELLTKVADGSVIKITLRAQPTDYSDPDAAIEIKKRSEFHSEFEALLPSPACDPPRDLEGFAYLVQEMLQIACQKALPSVCGRVFQPLSSFCYTDGVGIFTLTGIVCPKNKQRKIQSLFASWQFKNLSWRRPTRIDVPVLSTKERLHLQRHLPCLGNAGVRLSNALGYLVDETRRKSLRKMKQYALFHRYYPYFMRAVP